MTIATEKAIGGALAWALAGLFVCACSGDDTQPAAAPDTTVVADTPPPPEDAPVVTPDTPPDVTAPGPEEKLLSVKETEAWDVPGLGGDVHVVRTEGNVPHVYAKDRNDLARVLGFVVARDRYFIMDLQRRLGLGTLSELLGDVALDRDFDAREHGQTYVADRIAAGMSADVGAYIDAFALGVNDYIAQVGAGKVPPPSELELATLLLGVDKPVDLMKPWDRRSVAGMIAVVVYETNFEGGDVGRTANKQKLAGIYPDGFEAELRKKGYLADIWEDITPMFPGSWSTNALKLSTGAEKPGAGTNPGAATRSINADLLARTQERLDAFELYHLRDDIAGFGSNAWAVAGSASKDGDTLVAGDGHLQLSVPSLMYQVGLDTAALGGGQMTQLGLFLTGLPILAVGTNGHVAWSQVNPVTDITDWYREEVKLDDKGLPAATWFKGEWKPVTAVEETYVVADVPALGSKGRTEKWTRWVTFDGRWIANVEGRVAKADEVLAAGESLANLQGALIVPGDQDSDAKVTAISFDYTAFDITGYVDALDRFGFAKSVEEYRQATKGLIGNGLFSAAGDSAGSILYTAYEALPCRKYLARQESGDWADGSDPALLLDGTVYGGFSIPSKDGVVDEAPGKADPYQCVVPFDETPQAIDPKRGFVFTANNDPGAVQVDGKLWNDAWYFGGPFDNVRADTIRRELQEAVDADSADVAKMAEIQANADSRMGETFAGALGEAISVARDLAAKVGPLEAHDARLLALYQAHTEEFDAVDGRMKAWKTGGFKTPSGVETFYHQPTASELPDSVATMIFNAWFGRYLASVFGDEPVPWRFGDGHQRPWVLEKFLEGRGADNPKQLASWNPATGESIFFDRLGTDEVERSRELMLSTLADALAFLGSAPTGPGEGGFGTTDMSKWIWGLRHQARFESLLGDFLGGNPSFAPIAEQFSITTKTLPLAGDLPAGDPRSGLKWFPRGGDQWSVDAANAGFSGTHFTHGNGPVMRMVISLKGGEVKGQNIVPGGQSALTGSPFFADQAAKWLANEAYPLRFSVDDVVAGAIGREVYRASTPP